MKHPSGSLRIFGSKSNIDCVIGRTDLQSKQIAMGYSTVVGHVSESMVLEPNYTLASLGIIM